MEWNGKRFFHIPYWQFSSIPLPFHTKNLPFHFPFHTKIFFHIPFHTSIPMWFRQSATRNLYCTFATLSMPSQIVAREGKQHSTIDLIPHLKHYRNELPEKFTQHENIIHLINRQ